MPSNWSCAPLGLTVLSRLPLGLLAVKAGVGERAVRYWHLVVAGLVDPLDGLRRPVELAVAVGVGPGVFVEQRQ